MDGFQIGVLFNRSKLDIHDSVAIVHKHSIAFPRDSAASFQNEWINMGALQYSTSSFNSLFVKMSNRWWHGSCDVSAVYICQTINDSFPSAMLSRHLISNKKCSEMAIIIFGHKKNKSTLSVSRRVWNIALNSTCYILLCWTYSSLLLKLYAQNSQNLTYEGWPSVQTASKELFITAMPI